MIGKISRSWNAGHYAGEMVSPRRHRILAGPGTVLLLAYVLMFQFAGSVHAQSVTLAWDANTDPNLAGYRVYRSQQSGVYSSSLNGALLTAASFTDSTVQAGRTYYYVVTAISTTGLESGYSGEAQAIIPLSVTNIAPTANAGPDQTITLPATATLTATASDDGLPNNTLTYQWTVLSGTGVSLTPTNTASTKATFTTAGTYTFRVFVSDGLLSGSDDVIVVVNATATTNKAPTVNAGADQTITLPGTATLTATASDDGLPNNTLTYQWTVLSGSGVSLTPTNTASTKATFTTAGTYTFRITVSDGLLSGSDDVIVVVNAVATTNKAPTVNAGPDQTITLPATANLSATVTDDGLPNNTLSYQWIVVSGSGVMLQPTNTAATKVTFTVAGTYTFRLTVSDGQLSTSDDVMVTVLAAATTNKAPTVNAGLDQNITLPAAATLTATASDDGLPSNTLTYQWSVVTGSGVVFSNASSPSVQVSFTTAGTYTLRVTVSDGQLTASDDVVVVVNATTSDLIITVSKNGATITGAIVPVYVVTTTTQSQTLELLIDGQKQASATGTSLTFRWKTNKVPSGSHTVTANSYLGQVKTATKSLNVTLQ
jgi:K319-like protein/Big-like domain-containing protein